MLLAHTIGIPHHAEEITILRQVITLAAPTALLLWAAAASWWRATKTNTMPCDTIQTSTVEFGKNTDRASMLAALTALGLYKGALDNPANVVRFGSQESFDFTTGKITLAAGRTVAEVKREYSNQVVLGQAKRYGWTVKETAPYQYEILKR